MTRHFTIAIAIGLAACGNSSPCAQGATQTCACPNSAQGAQRCLADGAGWSNCECIAPKVCAPNQTQACACPDATQGAQTCGADGLGWLPCTCSSPAKPEAAHVDEQAKKQPLADAPQRVATKEIHAVIPAAADALAPQEVAQRFGGHAPDVLERDPRLLAILQRLEPAFRAARVETTQVAEAVRTRSGREIVLLWGCTPHECGGTTYAIAYEPRAQVAAFLKEPDDPNATGFLLFGAPDPELRAVLFVFAGRQI